MQRVRNNIHKARKHTQKAKKDVRRLKARRLRDYEEKEIPEATLRAMKEAEEFSKIWLEWHKSLEDEPVD